MNSTRRPTEKTDAHPPVALYFRRYGGVAAPSGPGDSADSSNSSAAGATPLLILHGLFGSGANWRGMAGRLAARRVVYCLDLRNHGNSPWHDEMDYAAMAGDVARFIADRGLRRPALLGHSMGGKVAMTLAQQSRVALARLVVVDIAPAPYPDHRHDQLLDAMQALDTHAADRRQLDAALAARIPDPATRQFLAQNLRRDGAGYRWQLNLAAIRRNMDALAGYAGDGASAVEALFIAGANSDYLAAARHAEVYARFPNARIAGVENAGHWLHAEQPARLAALCDAFLAG